MPALPWVPGTVDRNAEPSLQVSVHTVCAGMQHLSRSPITGNSTALPQTPLTCLHTWRVTSRPACRANGLALPWKCCG